MIPGAVALIDGEHYPPVVKDALLQLAGDFDFRAALFLGGTEKVAGPATEDEARAAYGVPVVFDTDRSRGLARALREYAPEVVVDLSDEPVLGYEERFRLISECLARNVGYVGPDFHFSPASSDRLCTSPSLSVIGTGKRVGKTAVSGHIARVLQDVVTGRDGRPGVVVVTMGRGGPAEPEVIEGAGAGLSVSDLLALSRQGRHAASDHFEDAVLGRVTTVGCRRCGGGMAGQPFVSNVPAGVALANSLEPGLIVLEGSGAALPPVQSDTRVLVAGAHQPVAHITGYLGRYRLLISDALVLTMAEEPLARPEEVRLLMEAVWRCRPEMTIVPVVFRPHLTETVEGRRVAFFTTAPAELKDPLKRHLEEEWGCTVEFICTDLADRTALRAGLAHEAMNKVEAVLTEIKAAAIDVVAEEAEARGLPVVLVDNRPVEACGAEPGRLAEVIRGLAATARDRFDGRS